MLSCSPQRCTHLIQLHSPCLQDTKLAILMELCQYGSFFKLIRMARQIKNMKESERIQVGPALYVSSFSISPSPWGVLEIRASGAAVQQPGCVTPLGLLWGQPSSELMGASIDARCMAMAVGRTQEAVQSCCQHSQRIGVWRLCG